jgi:chemotaxis protein histidine kinase CheA
VANSVKKIGPVAFNFAGRRMTMLIIAGGGMFVLLILYLILFHRQNVSSASIPAAPNVETTVGGAGTPVYNAAVTQANAQQAKQQGSTVATPIGIIPQQSQGMTPLSAPQIAAASTPAQQPEKEPHATAQQQQNVPQYRQAPVYDNQAMKEEVSSILKVMQEQTNAPFQTAVIPVAVAPSASAAQPASSASSAQAGKTEQKDAEAIFVKKHLKPGHLLYATFVNRLQSDVPGPAVGEIVEGPLSGYRLMGEWTRPKESNVLSVAFSGVVTPSGEVVPIKAVAVDPNTTLPGNASSVDHLLLERTANFLGATFIAMLNGYSQAASNAGQTVVTNGLSNVVTTPAYTAQQARATALNNATKVLSPVSEQMMQKVVQPSIVHVAPGTPFGLLVLQVK